MIHYFDFEEGRAPGQVPTLMPITDLTGQDPSFYAFAVLMMANGKVLKIIATGVELEVIGTGSRVVIVFDEGMRIHLKKQGWGDPGPGMAGILEGIIPLEPI